MSKKSWGGDARRVTIKDIAQRCQLSVSTVSHVLNGQQGRYSEETARKVWEAIRELGYQPNQIGRMLRTGNQWLFGALVPNLNNVFYADFIQALDVSLQKADRLLLTVTLGDTFDLQQRTIKNLNGAMLAGLVFIGSTPQELHQIVTLSHQNWPLVFVNRAQSGLYASYPGVGIDNFRAGFDVAVAARSQGRQRVAILRGPDFSYASRQRYEGFLSGWVQSGHSGEIVFDQAVELTTSAGFQHAAAVLSAGPDVVYCGNDMIALGVTQYFAMQSVDVPESILVTGFDYNSLTRVVGTRLLTVAQPIEEMAQWVARWLIQPNADREAVHCTMPHRLVWPDATTLSSSQA